MPRELIHLCHTQRDKFKAANPLEKMRIAERMFELAVSIITDHENRLGEHGKRIEKLESEAKCQN